MPGEREPLRAQTAAAQYIPQTRCNFCFVVGQLPIIDPRNYYTVPPAFGHHHNPNQSVQVSQNDMDAFPQEQAYAAPNPHWHQTPTAENTQGYYNNTGPLMHQLSPSAQQEHYQYYQSFPLPSQSMNQAATAPIRRSHFLEMDVAIRNRIYAYLVGDQSIQITQRAEGEHVFNYVTRIPNPQDTSLYPQLIEHQLPRVFVLCRQTYNEARYIYFRLCVFGFISGQAHVKAIVHWTSIQDLHRQIFHTITIHNPQKWPETFEYISDLECLCDLRRVEMCITRDPTMTGAEVSKRGYLVKKIGQLLRKITDKGAELVVLYKNPDGYATVWGKQVTIPQPTQEQLPVPHAEPEQSDADRLKATLLDIQQGLIPMPHGLQPPQHERVALMIDRAKRYNQRMAHSYADWQLEQEAWRKNQGIEQRLLRNPSPEQAATVGADTRIEPTSVLKIPRSDQYTSIELIQHVTIEAEQGEIDRRTYKSLLSFKNLSSVEVKIKCPTSPREHSNQMSRRMKRDQEKSIEQAKSEALATLCQITGQPRLHVTFTRE